MSGRKRKIIVRLGEWPEDADDNEIAGFVESALSSWGGSCCPTDPLFESLDVISVQIGNTIYKIPKSCDVCGINPADLPGKLCAGCEAYKEHTGQI